jgi:hypothetical protein
MGLLFFVLYEDFAFTPNAILIFALLMTVGSDCYINDVEAIN